MFKKMLSAGIMLAGLGMGTGLVLGGDKPANMMINPGAEDVVPRGEYKHIVLKGVPSTMLPPGWGAYAGGRADVKWSTDDASPHSGKRCLTATVLSPIEKGKGNFGLILGESDGYNGSKAFDAAPGEKYYFSFWWRGDVTSVNIEIIGWKTGAAERDARLSGICLDAPKSAEISAVWTEVTGCFTAPPDMQKFAVGVFMLEAQTGQFLSLDDAVVKPLPKVEAVSSKTDILKVGVYDNGESEKNGAHYIAEALKGVNGVEVETIDTLATDRILKYDTLVIANSRELSKKDAGASDMMIKGVDYIQNLLAYVDSGHGLILGHDCVGYRGIWGKFCLFPQFVSADKKVDWKQKLSIKDKTHPLAEGLPGSFAHNYWDHLVLNTGSESATVAEDEDGNAVVTASKYPRGRIVAIGYPMGCSTAPGTTKEKPVDQCAPLSEIEKRLLINAVKWTGSAPRYNVPLEVTSVGLYEFARSINAENSTRELDQWAKFPAPDFQEKIMFSYLFRASSPGQLQKMIQNCADMGFDGIMVDGIIVSQLEYPSKYYPEDSYKNNTFDKLAVCRQETRKLGMKLGIQISPFQCMYTGDKSLLDLSSKDHYKEFMTNSNCKVKENFWQCPDNPVVRERSMKGTEEIIKKYNPDCIMLDFIRYMAGYDTPCRCELSLKRMADFAKSHPEIKPADIDQQFAQESLMSYVQEWVKLCKSLKPDIITSAYTMTGPTRWVFGYPVDRHMKYASRTTGGDWKTVQATVDLTKKYYRWNKELNLVKGSMFWPIIASDDPKGPRRLDAELRALNQALNESGAGYKSFMYYQYSYLVAKDGNLDKTLAAFFRKAFKKDTAR